MLHYSSPKPSSPACSHEAQTELIETSNIDKNKAVSTQLTCVLIIDRNEIERVKAFANSIPDVTFYTVTTTAAPETFVQTDQLSERLEQVLRLIGQGMSNKVIGRLLGISHFTVRNHVSRLLRIYNVSKREDLVSLIDSKALS